MNAPVPRKTDERLPILFDFDDTLAEGTWPSPELGPPIREGVELLVHYASEGYCVKIFTARPASHAPRIWQWLTAHGLLGAVYDVICEKPPATLYIDDRAFNPLGLYENTRARAREDEVPLSAKDLDPNDWTVMG